MDICIFPDAFCLQYPKSTTYLPYIDEFGLISSYEFNLIFLKEHKCGIIVRESSQLPKIRYLFFM